MTALLQQILPTQRETTPEELAVAALQTLATPLGAASPEAIAYCNELSHNLLKDPRARAFPSMQALGFWLRPGSIVNMVHNYLAAPEGTVRAPRGIVFQIPPRNVGVLFGYTSALALLGGNIALMRLHENPSEEQDLLVTLIAETIAKCDAAIQNRMVFIRYGHDDTITSALSALCDARLVWGGDETVEHIRSIPLPSLAREMSFADRFSAVTIKASHYQDLHAPDKQQLIRAIANDIYLFDQMACSSPRLLIWVGDEKTVAQAADDFYPRLADYALDRYGHPAAGENLSKLNAQFVGGNDLKLSSTSTYNAALTVMTLAGWEGLSAYKTVHFGFGLLLATRLQQLRDLAAYAEKRDQTLAVWGFGPDEVQSFVTQCDGRGFDRIVPVGQALAFDPVWDGNNLFDILTRLIQITV